jgi:penicillin-binding protein 2
MKINRGKEVFSSRYYIIISVISILMLILVCRIFILTVLQNSKWTSEANQQSIKSIYTSAPRGNIYDCNGKVIATNKQIFTVIYNSSGLETSEINDSSLELINTS